MCKRLGRESEKRLRRSGSANRRERIEGNGKVARGPEGWIGRRACGLILVLPWYAVRVGCQRGGEESSGRTLQQRDSRGSDYRMELRSSVVSLDGLETS